jgi:hypothetical protein
LTGRTLYVGGPFTNIGGQPRNRIAAFDRASGALTGWNPGSSHPVNAIAPDGPTVYVGGEFTSIGGQPRNRIAALDSTTGLATAWNPGSNGPIKALLAKDGIVYAGGFFSTIGGDSKWSLAALDAASGAAIPGWTPTIAGSVEQLTAIGGSIGVSGQFAWIHNQPQANFALIANAVTSVPESPGSIGGIQLAIARPNPAATTTRIGFTLAHRGHVTLAVYDLAGREVRRLVDVPHPPGEHEVRFDASTLPNGLYLYRLRAGGTEVTRKLVVTH